MFAAMGILIALHERERSGRGQWVQTSLLQAQIFMLDFQAARYPGCEGDVAGQVGNNHPTGAPTGVFRTLGRLRQRRAHARHVEAILQSD